MEHCSKLDTCPKIKVLRDHDWVSDAQFSEAILKTCDKCEEKK
jgi:hypothetical protein